MRTCSRGRLCFLLDSAWQESAAVGKARRRKKQGQDSRFCSCTACWPGALALKMFGGDGTKQLKYLWQDPENQACFKGGCARGVQTSVSSWRLYAIKADVSKPGSRCKLEVTGRLLVVRGRV